MADSFCPRCDGRLSMATKEPRCPHCLADLSTNGAETDHSTPETNPALTESSFSLGSVREVTPHSDSSASSSGPINDWLRGRTAAVVTDYPPGNSDTTDDAQPASLVIGDPFTGDLDMETLIAGSGIEYLDMETLIAASDIEILDMEALIAASGIEDDESHVFGCDSGSSSSSEFSSEDEWQMAFLGSDYLGEESLPPLSHEHPRDLARNPESLLGHIRLWAPLLAVFAIYGTFFIVLFRKFYLSDG